MWQKPRAGSIWLKSKLIHNMRPNRETRRSRRAGRIEHVERAFGTHDMKIFHEFAVRRHGLRAHAGAAGIEVREAHIRDQRLEVAAEALRAQRLGEFPETHRAVTPHESPQAGKEQRLREIAWVD